MNNGWTWKEKNRKQRAPSIPKWPDSDQKQMKNKSTPYANGEVQQDWRREEICQAVYLYPHHQTFHSTKWDLHKLGQYQEVGRMKKDAWRKDQEDWEGPSYPKLQTHSKLDSNLPQE